MIVKTFLLICAIGLCAAVEKSCPPDSTGEYPKCLCNNFDFIFKDNACVKVNREECPSPAIKVDGKVGCRCPDPTDFFDDYYWFCRTKLYLPTPTPSTTTTVRPTIRTCPAYHRGTWPDCVRIPCGDDQPGRYAPDCVHVTFRPVTYTPVKVCPHPQVGSYPHCQYPCPPHTTRKDFNGTCVPIPCTKGRGWTGDFMPNCTYTPFCPDEFPGHFPYCNRYALVNGTTTRAPTTTLSTTRSTTTTTTTTTRRPITPTATTTTTTTTPRPTTPIATTTTTTTTRRPITSTSTTTTTTTTRRPITSTATTTTTTTTPRPTTTTTQRTTTPQLRTSTAGPTYLPPIECNCCGYCEVPRVEKVLQLLEDLYGRDVIERLGGKSVLKLNLKKPYTSRVPDELFQILRP